MHHENSGTLIFLARKEYVGETETAYYMHHGMA
jgi:hypothetical protein